MHEPPEGAFICDETKVRNKVYIIIYLTMSILSANYPFIFKTPNRKRRDKDADLPRRLQNPRKKNKGTRAQIEPESDNEDDDEDVEDDGPCAAGAFIIFY